MKEIKLGVSISLSGRYSVQGTESFDGLTLWVKDTNQSGGILIKKKGKKIPVNLIYYDDGSSSETCKILIDKLIIKDKVDVLIGPYSSGLTLSAAPIVDKYKKILWNHGGSSDEIFEKGFRYIVSTTSPASKYLHGIIDMVRTIDKEAKKIALIQADDSGFSTNVAEGAKRYGKEKGFQVTNFKYQSGTKDFSFLLNNVKQNNPDIILSAGRAEDDLILAKQILEHKVVAKAIGLVVAGIKHFKEQLGKDAEGFLGPTQWERGIKIKPDFGPTPEEFFKRFKETYGKEPDYPAAQGYNIGLVIQKGIEESGTLEDISIRETAGRTQFRTFYGDFKIDPVTGNQIGHKMVIVQWQGSNKFIVFPKELSEKDPLYPKP
ncbi:MAG TPA: amino acid ABC transporter substrate-binding protein [Thermodesulfobacteriota bacterium]|nr:amino acid ABC transporter substrate-binding protein [Thermodesulfobacteriota bacterium]